MELDRQICGSRHAHRTGRRGGEGGDPIIHGKFTLRGRKHGVVLQFAQGGGGGRLDNCPGKFPGRGGVRV